MIDEDFAMENDSTQLAGHKNQGENGYEIAGAVRTRQLCFVDRGVQ